MSDDAVFDIYGDDPYEEKAYMDEFGNLIDPDAIDDHNKSRTIDGTDTDEY